MPCRGRIHKLIAVTILILIIATPVVSAWTTDFQNDADQWVDRHYYHTSLCDCPTCSSWVLESTKVREYPYFDTNSQYAYIGTGSYCYQSKIHNRPLYNSSPTNYWAFSAYTPIANGGIGYGYSYPQIQMGFYDASGANVKTLSFGTSTLGIPYTGQSTDIQKSDTWHRMEVLRENGYLKIRRDGMLIWSDTSGFGNSITMVELLSASSRWGYSNFDDFSWGQTNANMISVMPHSWYVAKDMIDPSMTGLYDYTNTLRYSDNFHVMVSISPFADGWDIQTPANGQYTVELTTPTGGLINIYPIDFTAWGTDDQTVKGTSVKHLTYYFNQTHLGNAPIEYGQYYVTLKRNGVIQDTDSFFVIGRGAGLAWNKNKYTTNDAASISYTVTEEYWIPSDYTYRIRTFNGYGETLDTIPVTMRSGSVSLSLPEDNYPGGVYFAVIEAVPKTSSTPITMNYALMEVQEQMVIEGYVNDGETESPIAGAVVSAVQNDQMFNATTDPNGWFSIVGSSWVINQEMGITTTTTGYQTDYRAFTPPMMQRYSFNISMLKNDWAESSVCVGGIVWDTTFHNPVAAASVYAINGTENHVTTTNSAGFYKVEGVDKNNLYDLSAKKNGYILVKNMTVKPVAANEG